MRCEGYRRRGGAFSLGPAVWEQCKEEATVMLEMVQEGRNQKLPACPTCWKEALRTPTIKILKVDPI